MARFQSQLTMCYGLRKCQLCVLLIYPPGVRQVPTSFKTSLVNFHTECQFYEGMFFDCKFFKIICNYVGNGFHNLTLLCLSSFARCWYK